jgi:hypothetical protein
VQLPTVLRRLGATLATVVVIGAQSAGAIADAPAPELHLTFTNGLSTHSAPNDIRVPVEGVFTENGRPVAGAAVTVGVIAETGPAGPAVPVGTVTTDSHGRFSLDVPPGDARTVVAISGEVVSNTLLIEQGARIHLTAAPRVVQPRHTTTFSGQIDGLMGVQVLVQLQVRKGVHDYQTFLVVRSQSDGTFRGRFRFGSDHAHFQFRALVVAQTGFPFARSESNLTAVTVR